LQKNVLPGLRNQRFLLEWHKVKLDLIMFVITGYW